MATILDHRGRPMAVSPAREVAASTNALYGQLQIQSFDPGLFIYHTRDPLIAYKGFQTIEKMLEDPQVAASVGLIRYAVLAGGYTVAPADQANPRAVEVAKFVKHVFKTMPGSLEDVAWRILDALPRGFALAEKTWEVYKAGPYKGKLGIKHIKAKKPGAWRFDLDEFDNMLAVQSLNPGAGYGERYPTDKFMHFAWSPEYENPYGQTILRAAYRHWWSKDATIKFWNVFNDKFGAPTLAGKYDDGEPEDVIDKVLEQLKAFQTDGAIAYPKTWEIELLEIKRSGQSAYEQAVRYHDEQIALAITGQSLATNQHSKGGGSRAQGEVHENALLINEGVVKRRLEEVINEQLVRQMVEYNFPDAEDLFPTVTFADLKPEDTKAIAEVLGEMMDRGVVGPGEEWVRERLKFPADERTPEERAIDLDRLSGKGLPQVDPKEEELDEEGIPPQRPKRKPATPPRREHAACCHAASREPRPHAFGRPLTTFERRLDFERIEEESDSDEAKMIAALSAILRRSRAELIARVQEGGLFGIRGNLDGVKRLTLSGSQDLTEAIRTALDARFRTGISDAEATVASLRVSSPSPVAAIEIPPPAAGALPRTVREMAEEFLAQRPALIGLEIEGSVMDEVRTALLQAIRQDWSETETIAAVTAAFDRWIDDVDLGDAGMHRAVNLQAVARTNLNDAYNSGLRSNYSSPENKGFITALMYSAVLDTRTTPFCRAWDGVIRPVDDPIWNRVTPPNHYGERSILIPLTRDDDFEVTKDLPSIRPQKGF